MGEGETGAANMYRQQGIPDQGRMSSHSAMQHATSTHGHPGHPGHPAHAHSAHVQHSTAHMGSMYGSGVYGSQAALQQQQQQQAQVCTLYERFYVLKGMTSPRKRF